MVRLPMLGERQAAHQRAFLKVQDGCDAHCTYCIIPRLRPGLWSKPVDEAVDEARRLVDAGHREIVLTGIFLGAYGQSTALRRRQGENGGARELGRLVEALCTRVPGLRRVRLSSLEPGDVTAELVGVLRAHRQVVPHFHLPLQSGSDAILRKMNRQYTRGEFLEMAARLNEAFDRPAITTDIIVGFPGETAEEFERTVDVAERVGFVHTHAFSYSPRPGTAAARWTKRWVRGPVVNERIGRLVGIAARKSEEFRRGFLGELVEVLVERTDIDDAWRHGRSERYFDVAFRAPAGVTAGAVVRVRVDAVDGERTVGTVVEVVG
ncbi:MAG: MiaB/RimO family radical SAM methylthiotransferase [Phycisphaerae bacterium]